jgi:Fe-S cluster assembly protein SufB
MPTPTAQEERVEVRALKGEYQFGFHDPDQSVFRAKKGLDRDIVEQISEMKEEPEWMRDYRLRALEIFLQKPLPTWGGKVSDIDFDDIYYYVKPSQGEGRTWEDVPENIKKTFDRLGIPEAERKFLAGVGAQPERGSRKTRRHLCVAGPGAAGISRSHAGIFWHDHSA